jgi:hypothetical protein
MASKSHFFAGTFFCWELMKETSLFVNHFPDIIVIYINILNPTVSIDVFPNGHREQRKSSDGRESLFFCQWNKNGTNYTIILIICFYIIYLL